MNKIFALDLGTNSIGWALRNPDLKENQIEKVGVLTFKKGVGNSKSGEYSYAAERTKNRSTRRLYQARKYRLRATLDHLINEGFCPLSIEDLNKWKNYNKEEALKNNKAGRVYPISNLAFDKWIKLDFDGDGQPDYSSPYQLRKELAEVKLDFSLEKNRKKLGRALYHIAQRRGFKSSRKGSSDVKEKEENKDIDVVEVQYSEKKKNNKLKELFPDFEDSIPIGTFLAKKEKEGVRIRQDITQYLVRQNYKDEINFIFQFQKIGFDNNLYKKLIESGKNKNDGSIFYKRPLRSQKGLIGKCTLEPNKYRAPISHPSFEIFRAWSFLNNIKYKPIGEYDTYWQPIPLELKQKVYTEKFFRKSKSYFPFSEIEEFIKKEGHKWSLNYKSKTTVTASSFSGRLKEIFGEDYMNIKIAKDPSKKINKDFYDIEDIWHVLFSYEDQEYVNEFAEKALKLDNEKVKQFISAWNATPVGYAMLSLNAINKINIFLEKGLIYTEAVLLANIPEIIEKEIWQKNETLFINEIGKVIDENRHQKTIISILNNLVSKHKNLESNEKFGYKDDSYKLVESDIEDINIAIIEQIGQKKWNEKEDKLKLFNIIKDCYQSYFITSGLKRKDINNERFHIVVSNGIHYYKSDSGYYKMPKLIDTLGDFLQLNFNIEDDKLLKIYHPSEINIYPPAKHDKNGDLKLGSPKTGSFKNPMAMRTLHELQKLMNFMIETNQIDNDTRIVVEVARELNDSNKRWAIEAWQKQRETENVEFEIAIEQLLLANKNIDANSKNEDDIDKVRIWYEQNNEEAIPPVTEDKKEINGIRWSDNKKSSYKEIIAKKEMIDKYRLWLEQECACIYTGKMIKITDLFKENLIDFEHTIPRSISFDNSLANLTVCYHDYNRTIKKNQIPFNLNNYKEDYGGYTAILPRLKKWIDKVDRIKQQIDFWLTKSKKASDKEWKDKAIRERLLWQMELEYWKNKVDRFTLEEVTSGFKNSQKIDTQLISKYAFHYLKTYFEKVDVQKGSITSEFRKIYGLQAADKKKDRSKHSHHAKDAAVLTLIPVAAKRDEILKDYYEHKERKQSFSLIEPFKGFKREFIWKIDDSILINNLTNHQALTPAKRIVRKRGKIQFIKGTNEPMISTGDCIRGQLHDETFLGAIKPALRDKNGNILRDDLGKIIQEEKIKYVVRVPFLYKKNKDSPGFKTLEDLEKLIVDKPLFLQIAKQVKEIGSFKDAMESGIYMLDKKGNRINKIRHIRVFKASNNPLQIKAHTYLSRHEYKQTYYANNATNSFFAIYQGKNKKDCDFRNLFETSQILANKQVNKIEDLFEPRISIQKGMNIEELNLKYILQNGTKLFIKKNKDEELKNYSAPDLSNRLYIFTNFESDGRLNFRWHLEARESKEIKEEYKESEIDFDKPKPTLRFSYSKYDFLVENYDFKIKIDGEIKWLF